MPLLEQTCSVLMMAIIDRLLHHGEVSVFNGLHTPINESGRQQSRGRI